LTDRTLLPVATFALPNGAVLYHIKNNSRLTRIQAVMRTGSIHEGVDSGSGLSHFLEHMLFQGCARYPGNSASDAIHQMGGDCNAYTTFDHTAYYAEVPAEKFAEAADVIAAMVTAPLFPEDKFKSEKEVIAREADMILDRPAYRLIQQLWQGMYGNHPAGMPIVGYPDKIAQVTCQVMRDYYLRRYGAMRSHWIVSGSLDSNYVQSVMAGKLASFQRGNLLEPVCPEVPENCFEQRLESSFKDPLTRIALGIRAPRPGRKTPALDLLAGILGGNDSSYLVKKFLYETELALAIDAEFDSMSFGSVMAVSAVCEPDKSVALEAGIRDALEKIRRRGVNAEDLQKEKLQQKITIYQQLKNTASQVSMVNSLRMNFNNAEALEQYLENLNSVTLDEVNAAAAEYLDPARFVWSKVVPEKPSESVTFSDASAVQNVIVSGKFENLCSYATVERSNIPMETLSILLPAGPVWENGCPHGISTMLSKILSTGPDNIPEADFYEMLDNAGIDLDVSCGNNSMSIEMSFPPESRSLAHQLMQDLLRHPRQDAQVFSRIQNNLIEQLTSKLNETGFAALQKARRLLFGVHPGGNSRLESVEDLQQITPEILNKFYFSCWDKSLANIGTTVKPDDPLEAQRVTAELQQLAAACPWQETALIRPQPVTRQDLTADAMLQPFIIPIDREQATVVCAILGGLAHQREYYALLILDAALNGLASHLFKEVREKRSLAYSTGVVVHCGLVQGMVALHAGVKPENAAAALQCLQDEITRLRTNGLEADEFNSAKLAALTSLARQQESAESQLIHTQLTIFYGGQAGPENDASSILQSIDCSECNRILHRIFNSSPTTQVVAGNIKKSTI